jgi:hypothetical protein
MTDLRHMCRKCRSKLPEPVENPHHAFCKRGCHTSFYRKHCLVCEQELAPGPDHRKFCKRPRCKSKYRQFLHVYDFPGGVPGRSSQKARSPLKTPIKSGIESRLEGDFAPLSAPFWRDRTGRGWRWERFDPEHWLFDREGEVQVRLIPDGDLYIVRLSPGIDHGVAALDEAKRRTVSLALARLPLEPGLAARLAKINELPPDPPQHLLPQTETYLAGLAAVAAGTEAPSIVPDDMGVAADADLEIPSFLVRGL